MIHDPRYESDGILSRRAFCTNAVKAAAILPFAGIAEDLVKHTAKDLQTPLCLFSKHLQWLDVPAMAATVASLGYDGVDLTVRKGGHIEPENVETDLPKAVAAITKAGLVVPMIVTDVIDPKSALTERVLRAANRAGIRYYRTAYLAYDYTAGVAANLKAYKKQLRELAQLNRKYNIHGAYQNHSGNGVGAAVWDLWILVKDLDPRWMGVQYDIKHATAEGGLSWMNGLDVLKDYIRCIDIKDFYWEKTGDNFKQKLVPLGEGMVDFKKYFSLLKKYNFTGPMSVHFEYPLGGAENGRKEITIPKEEVLNAMRSDLKVLRNLLKNADAAAT